MDRLSTEPGGANVAAGADRFDQMKHTWQGSREVLLAQLVPIVERFIRSDRLTISPPLFYRDELRRRLIITLNMSRVVQNVWEAVRQENAERLVPVFDRERPLALNLAPGDALSEAVWRPASRAPRFTPLHPMPPTGTDP